MSLEADYVVDRRRLKRRLLFWRLLALVILGVAAITALTDIEEITDGDHIARLSVSGIIVDDIDRERILRELKEDEGVHALIVRIDSPGGTVVGGESLYHQLKDIGDKKPVVAVMGSMATSAGYMTALGADHLIAREGSLTGSIGVLLQTADMTGLLEKIGVKPETIKSGPLKAQPNPMEPFSPEAREATKEVVMDMYAMFIGMVARNRNMANEQVKDLVSHVHMKSFDPATGSWCLVHEGAVDWPRQLQALAADGFTGAAVIETHLHISPDEFRPVDEGLSDRESNTRRNLEFVRSRLANP